ncbi:MULTISPECIES: hypothetical protein [Listeria]|uniref:hypothetical protein n=1 Tax=Listeria TaxID=1637 RepID=UPI000B58C708|nr:MULTISPECIES: hypothetical protein [Listeria]
MARPIKNKYVPKNFLYGTWSLEEFAQASPRTYRWWQDNIYDCPELADFSNWANKSHREPWVFDAAKANEWLLKKFVYKTL